MTIPVKYVEEMINPAYGRRRGSALRYCIVVKTFGETPVPLSSLVIYARDVEAMVRFYETHFSFRALRLPGDRIVELVAQDGGANIMLHPAAKSQKMGQVLVKLSFDVEDVEGFCLQAREKGLDFGPVHKADGYVYANAKDPCQNPISISSRAFRKGD